MGLGELQHFLQDIREITDQLAWKSCEYLYARAGNLGWWHLASKEVGEPAPQPGDIITFCGKSPEYGRYRCARWKLWPCFGRPHRIKICSTCYWHWKRRERERAGLPSAAPDSSMRHSHF